MRVTFVLPSECPAERALLPDPDAAPHEFQRGEDAWILQTYIRLKHAGCEVELAAHPPDSGIVVFHSKHARVLLRQRGRMKDVTLVGIRGDNRDVSLADFEVLQNGRFADGTRRFFIPHWPQPGLIPRDAGRGTRITNAAYKGFTKNLHPDFRSREWVEALAEMSITWQFDATTLAEQETAGPSLKWHDFSEVDLVVAVRPRDRRLHTPKPATKLVNCWHAGVPALLGAEYAYRELRCSELDYIEVSSLAEAKATVAKLVREPKLYAAMVENGHRRAVEFSNHAIVRQWTELLYETVPALADSRYGRFLRGTPITLRRFVRRLRRLVPWRPAR